MAGPARETRTVPVNWAVEVANRTKGLDFPLDKDRTSDVLEGMKVNGEDIELLLNDVSFPVDTPAELLHEISQAAGKNKGSTGGEW